jgi:hypothetical protein
MKEMTWTMERNHGEIDLRPADQQQRNETLFEIFTDLLPKFGPYWQRHSLVGLKVESLSRALHYARLYEKIVDVPGVICEFGVQWGATMVELINLRSIFEPFNQSRVIYGFDTFEGFPQVSDEDGHHSGVGDYASAEYYLETLSEILRLHEASAPMPHLKKHALIKGDASETFSEWLDSNPHAIIALAIFDMDLYKPTRDILEMIRPRLTKGSLLVFDELNCEFFPGETVAIREIIGTENIRLRRSPLQPWASWAVWGD